MARTPICRLRIRRHEKTPHGTRTSGPGGDASEVIETRGVDYNTVRPHNSLGYLTPEEFAASAAARPASPPTPVVSIAPTWEASDVQEPRSANL